MLSIMFLILIMIARVRSNLRQLDHSTAPSCFLTLCTVCEVTADTGIVSIAPFYPDTFCAGTAGWGDLANCVLYASDCAGAYTSHATITWAEASDYYDTGAIEIDTDAEASDNTSPTSLDLCSKC
jgi:hypothetical protein